MPVKLSKPASTVSARGRGKSAVVIGERVAVALAGAWRRPAPLFPPSAQDLASAGPCLLHTGAGGLGWRRLRRSNLRTTRPARELREALRLDTLQVCILEEHLKEVVGRLRSAGVEPVLIKGWSVARLYPEPGLRPYSDLDLCVRPDQLPATTKVLSAMAETHELVDLHEGVPEVADRTWEELYRRSRLGRLDNVDVRVLGPEDQLRLSCLHFWRHNACRPLWLCDIGAALEAIDDDFDWEYFLTGDPLLVDWIVTICALACRLLDARCKHPTIAERTKRLPRWLIRTVLWKCGPGVIKRPLLHYLRHPGELPAAVLYRWLDPIKACFRMGLPAARSMAWIQLVSLLGRPVELSVRARRIVAKRLRAWRRAPAQPFSLHLQGESRFL